MWHYGDNNDRVTARGRLFKAMTSFDVYWNNEAMSSLLPLVFLRHILIYAIHVVHFVTMRHVALLTSTETMSSLCPLVLNMW